jgi:DNA-binding CsgD family transcriptional regulator
VTAMQAAEIMQLSRHTVGKLVRSGTLKLDKTGRITMASIEAVMKGEKE